MTDAITKYAALAFLLIVAMACVGIGVYDILNGKPVEDFVKLIVSAGVGYALTALGVNHGAVVSASATAAANNNNAGVTHEQAVS